MRHVSFTATKNNLWENSSPVKDANGCTTSSYVTLGDGKGTCTGVIASQIQSSPFIKSSVSELNIKVLPNPSTTSFMLIAESKTSNGIEIIVTDAYGKKVYETKGSVNKQYTFGSDFTSGVYFVHVVQGNEFKTLKIIKAK